MGEVQLQEIEISPHDLAEEELLCPTEAGGTVDRKMILMKVPSKLLYIVEPNLEMRPLALRDMRLMIRSQALLAAAVVICDL